MKVIVALALLSQAPVADAVRFWVNFEAPNIIAAAEAMPAEKYDFRPTPQQMTFAHLVLHIATSNRVMCASIAGVPWPAQTSVTDKAAKDTLVAEVKESFGYCKQVLAKLDDSALDEQLPKFDRTRANVMMMLAADLADHYGAEAMYLRLNGLLPPTAHPPAK